MFLVPPGEIHPARQMQGSLEREAVRAVKDPTGRMGSTIQRSTRTHNFRQTTGD